MITLFNLSARIVQYDEEISVLSCDFNEACSLMVMECLSLIIKLIDEGLSVPT